MVNEALARHANERRAAEQAVIAALRGFLDRFPRRLLDSTVNRHTYVPRDDIRRLRGVLAELDALQPPDPDDTQDIISPAKCHDCGLPYSQFGLDTTLPDDQWRQLCPEDGLLCATCIAKRADRLAGAIAVRAVIETVDTRPLESVSADWRREMQHAAHGDDA